MRANGSTAELAERYAADLATLFITSDVSVASDPDLPLDADAATAAGARFTEPGGAAIIEAQRAGGSGATAAGATCRR